jgi:hypothetical protein
VRFGIGGTEYEIDLSKENARNFRQGLAPFVEHARRAGRGRRRRPARTSSARERSGDIRAWAKAHGIPVSDRGRIPAGVAEQYEGATGRSESPGPCRRASGAPDLPGGVVVARGHCGLSDGQDVAAASQSACGAAYRRDIWHSCRSPASAACCTGSIMSVALSAANTGLRQPHEQTAWTPPVSLPWPRNAVGARRFRRGNPRLPPASPCGWLPGPPLRPPVPGGLACQRH